jgi:hypothetical protein
MTDIGRGPQKTGQPRWRGKSPGEGVPKEQGTPLEQATLPEVGKPRGAGKLPEEEGVVLPGTEGQVPKGTPGTMEPWMENPWAPGALDDAWTATPAVPDDDDDDDDLRQDPMRAHPNLLHLKAPLDDDER